MRVLAWILLVVGATACSSTSSGDAESLGFPVPDVSNAMARKGTAGSLDRLLAQTQRDPERYATRRFWASYFLAQLHSRAAFEVPFLTEPGTGGAGKSPSPTAHLVATIDHAMRARNLYGYVSDAGIPLELAPLTFDAALSNLDFSLATAYSRLGFTSEVAERLESFPELMESKDHEAFFAGRELSQELRPWVCEMVSVHLRDRDELEAYRFAVLAIEGEERFGHALPRHITRALEDWILNGATVRFVCPRSQTNYVPGRRHSPVSGVAHLSYVAVAREARRSTGASRVR